MGVPLVRQVLQGVLHTEHRLPPARQLFADDGAGVGPEHIHTGDQGRQGFLDAFNVPFRLGDGGAEADHQKRLSHASPSVSLPLRLLQSSRTHWRMPPAEISGAVRKGAPVCRASSSALTGPIHTAVTPSGRAAWSLK